MRPSLGLRCLGADRPPPLPQFLQKPQGQGSCVARIGAQPLFLHLPGMVSPACLWGGLLQAVLVEPYVGKGCLRLGSCSVSPSVGRLVETDGA